MAPVPQSFPHFPPRPLLLTRGHDGGRPIRFGLAAATTDIIDMRSTPGRSRAIAPTAVLRLIALTVAGTTGAGCALGPRAVENARLPYNEAIKTTTEQQLLLNIVRLRYSDSPSSLSISAIADQREIVAGLKALPFFTAAAAGDVGSYRGAVLPQAELTRASRPTLSFTPIDDQEFTRRLFTPMSLEGMAYLGKTTW